MSSPYLFSFFILLICLFFVSSKETATNLAIFTDHSAESTRMVQMNPHSLPSRVEVVYPSTNQPSVSYVEPELSAAVANIPSNADDSQSLYASGTPEPFELEENEDMGSQHDSLPAEIVEIAQEDEIGVDLEQHGDEPADVEVLQRNDGENRMYFIQKYSIFQFFIQANSLIQALSLRTITCILLLKQLWMCR